MACRGGACFLEGRPLGSVGPHRVHAGARVADFRRARPPRRSRQRRRSATDNGPGLWPAPSRSPPPRLEGTIELCLRPRGPVPQCMPALGREPSGSIRLLASAEVSRASSAEPPWSHGRALPVATCNRFQRLSMALNGTSSCAAGRPWLWVACRPPLGKRVNRKVPWVRIPPPLHYSSVAGRRGIQQLKRLSADLYGPMAFVLDVALRCSDIGMPYVACHVCQVE